MTGDIIAMDRVASAPGYQALKAAYPGFNQQRHLGLGVTQIVLGTLIIISSLAAICMYMDFAGIGILAGAVIIVAGAFVIAATKRRSKCLVITALVMSVVAAAVGFIQIAIYGNDAFRYGSYQFWVYGSDALTCLLFLLSLAETIVAAVQAAFCCKHMASTGQPQLQMGQMTNSGVLSAGMTVPQAFILAPQGQLIPVYRLEDATGLMAKTATPPAVTDVNQPPAYGTEQSILIPEDQEKI